MCVGAEWHRFPSSFFLPAGYRLGFINTGFDGALPTYFPDDENTDAKWLRATGLRSMSSTATLNPPSPEIVSF